MGVLVGVGAAVWIGVLAGVGAAVWVGVLAGVGVAYFLAWWVGDRGYIYDVSNPYNIALFLSGVCAVYIIWQLRKLFKTLLGGNPFVMDNVNCFRKMAVASFLIAVIFAVKSMISFTYGAAIIVIVFAVAMLFCLTLKDVFKQAVYYKEENDWTV